MWSYSSIVHTLRNVHFKYTFTVELSVLLCKLALLREVCHLVAIGEVLGIEAIT
ncbi:MAG: hypothetical protein ACK49R_03890 [Planctomycetota bacterium]